MRGVAAVWGVSPIAEVGCGEPILGRARVSAGVVLGYLCDSVGLDRGYIRAGDKRGSDSHHRDISRGDTVVLLSVGFALQRLAPPTAACG